MCPSGSKAPQLEHFASVNRLQSTPIRCADSCADLDNNSCVPLTRKDVEFSAPRITPIPFKNF